MSTPTKKIKKEKGPNTSHFTHDDKTSMMVPIPQGKTGYLCKNITGKRVSYLERKDPYDSVSP